MNSSPDIPPSGAAHRRANSDESINERLVPVEVPELAPHVKVLRPTRSARVYDRIE
jgi:hypothetical protein